ncbi:hypothetical protein BDW74DRAFT_172667 [Aspergillus multicolor]|uniref:Zn(II)2Cys6 transcription factor n=1 Tax=Aspergillus multicolor TaxID=41759 RepID=UPI003CCCE2ED
MAGSAHHPCPRPRPRPPPNRRRDKVQLSCDSCRHRKRKCDRQSPCGPCVRRGAASFCQYATASSSTPEPHTQRCAPPRRSASTNPHDRISELEDLVVMLMNGQSKALLSPPAPKLPRSSSLPSTPADVFPQDQTLNKSELQDKAEAKAASPVNPSADPGTLKLLESGTGTSYVQSVHWEAVLAKIKGLKEDLVSDSKAPPGAGSHLFYGPNRHATRDEILAAVPPRTAVDRLMALHFDSHIITPYLIHRKKFLREYEAFWANPSTTSVAWIGLMFSMLYISARLQTFTIDFTNGSAGHLKADYLTMKDLFREKIVQCLILARYTKGGPYILETLITLLTGECVLLKDSATDGWLSISLILHIATRMGYHRDPNHFPSISPFDAEMRRRIWAAILVLDLGLSLESGLPRTARDTHTDTQPPRNLPDCDFDENTTVMPPARPETEWTPILPLIARARFIPALGLICDINSDIHPPSYEQVQKVDQLLGDLLERAIPPNLRWDVYSITDSPNIIVQRVSVQTTYCKARILLHRRALVSSGPTRHSQSQSPKRVQNNESVQTCLTSALKILSFQQMLHDEAQPFGRLWQLRWKVTHILTQDVLLATAVLCVYLQDVDRSETPESEVKEIRQQLISSHKLWLQLSTNPSTASTSEAAGKVARALRIVLSLGNAKTNMDVEASASVSPDDAAGSSTGLVGAPCDFSAPIEFDGRSGHIGLNEFGAPFNNQYLPFPSDFSFGSNSPLSFFENVLEMETQGA